MSRTFLFRRLGSWSIHGFVKDDLSERLAARSLFARCSTEEIRTICKAFDIGTVRPGTVLSSPAYHPNPLVLMLEGEAVSLSDDGVSDFLDGSLHGAAEELAGIPRRDQIVASTDAIVYLLEPRRLVPLLWDCPNFALSLMRQLAHEGCVA